MNEIEYVQYIGSPGGRLETQLLEPGMILKVNRALAKLLVKRGNFKFLEKKGTRGKRTSKKEVNK